MRICIGRSLSIDIWDSEECNMEIGKVKWFNNAKGYGFIVADGRDEDLFAHYSAILLDADRTLQAGQPVHFAILQGHTAQREVNARAISPAEDHATSANTPQTLGCSTQL